MRLKMLCSHTKAAVEILYDFYFLLEMKSEFNKFKGSEKIPEEGQDQPKNFSFFLKT